MDTGTDTDTAADGGTDASEFDDIETEGYLAPATVAAARDRYAEAVPTAKTATREAAKAMSFDREEYERRVTSDVVGTVRDAVFASSLQVQVADRETFEAWSADGDREVVLVGHDDAPRVVWHAPGFADSVVAATFADERAAAVSTLRRQAFGRLYRGVVDGEATGVDDTGDDGFAAGEADTEPDTDGS